MARTRPTSRPAGLARLATIGLTAGLIAVGGLVVLQRPPAEGAIVVPSAIAARPTTVATRPEASEARVIGSPAAPVTIEVWSDYQCPACRAFAAMVLPRIVEELVNTGRARVAYHDFAFIGPESMTAAVGARCAAREDRFEAYHEIVFANQRGENQGAFTTDRVVAIAELAGLDPASFEACLAEPGLAQQVATETAVGQRARDRGHADDRHRIAAAPGRAHLGDAHRGRRCGSVDPVSTSRAARRRERRRARAVPPLTPVAAVEPAIRRGTLGMPMVMAALAAVAVAGYLTIQHLAGAALECGPLAGCDSVQESIYSEVAGIPVALPGLFASALALAGAAGWWWRRERRWLEAAFVVTLASLVVLAYFTVLEALVIGAWCSWCLAYAGLTLTTFALATLAIRRPLSA